MRYIIHYRAEIRFALVLAFLVAISIWASEYIPAEYFDRVITPVLMTAATAVSLTFAWAISRHTDGYRLRRVWAWTLLLWGLADGTYIFFWFIVGKPVMNMGAYQLNIVDLMLGNLLAWSLLLYPTEALRPGWMNTKRALAQILPMYALGALDYFLPVNLQPIVALYPVALVALLFSHVRKYRLWCEENFSSLEDIDEKWIVRYMAIMFMVGVVYMYMCLTHGPARGFTQQWLVLFMFIYGSEQVLFRRDPWEVVRLSENKRKPEEPEEEPTPNEAYRKALEEWMEKEKPYLNTDFKLLDLQTVLPMNRTYLSQFIHSEYDCSFYFFVNSYRIEEAKRLMKENPAMKMADVSARCGFSSPSVFSRTFTAIEGKSPHDWGKQN